MGRKTALKQKGHNKMKKAEALKEWKNLEPAQNMKDLPHLQLPKLTSNQKREANRIELERERAERRTA
jgi:hypothetical protein